MSNRRPLHPLIKRSALRKARARIAAGAVPVGTREFNATVTRVFPVADEIGDSVWSISREAAQLLRSTAEKSLLGLVIEMHAAGWRFFPSGAERETFLLRGQMDTSSLDAQLRQAFGESLPKLCASSLRGILSQSPRKVGTDTDPNILVTRLLRAFGATAKTMTAPPVMVSVLANSLAEAFPTWRELSAINSDTGFVVDRALSECGIANAGLAIAWGATPPVMPTWMGVPTIAFDDGAPRVEEATIMSRFAAVVARYLPECGGLFDPGAIKAIQARVTTANGNAFSWLFGVGRRALREQSENDLSAALSATSPEGKAAVVDLVDGFRQLPSLDVLGENVYRDNRSALQGTIDSLIATYLGRLIELSATAHRLGDTPLAYPEALEKPDWLEAIFVGMPFTPDDVRMMFAALPEEVSRVVGALRVLAGEEQVRPGRMSAAITEVDRFGAWCERFGRVCNQVNARIDQTDAPASLKLPSLLGGDRWKSLVSMHEPEGPAIEVIETLDAELQAILDAGQVAYRTLIEAYAPTLTDIRRGTHDEISGLLDMARRRSAAVPATADLDALVARKLLDQVARLVRRADRREMAEHFIEICREVGIIRAGTASERSLRGHVFSGEQAIFANPLKARKSLVRFERDALVRLDPLRVLQAMQARAETLRDKLILRFAEETITLTGLPSRIDAERVTWGVGGDANTPPWADLRPSSDGTVSRSEVLKAFNAVFVSRANGLLYRLNRTQFVERSTLSCFSGQTILWSPRDGGWNPPAQYGVGKFADLLADGVLPRRADGCIDVVPAAKWLVKHAAKSSSELRSTALALLRQMPHVWVACCDLDGAQTYEGTFPSDGEATGWVKRKGVRFVPPPHFATALSEGFAGSSISPHSLTLERSMERDASGLRETARRAFVQVPIAAPVMPAEERWKPRHLVGLDLGEAALGVCLKHLDTGAESTMLLKTPRVRRVARQVEHYRRKQQPRQQFRKGYSESTEFAIEAAIGEVCSLIDNLIVRYDAVPVFEFGVSKARASNKMVQRIFAGVVQRYAFIANNQAAQAARQGHWLGAGRWSYGFGADVLPAARQMGVAAVERAKEEAVFRDAFGGPGVLVSGYRTSVICSCCGADPQDLLALAIAEGQGLFTTDADGVGLLHVNGAEHRVRIEAPSGNRAVQVAARRRKRRTPWEPLANRTFVLTRKAEAKELATVLKRGLRRPSASVGGSKTSGWEFHCPMRDCGVIAQADVNAAVNIVRRYEQRVRANQSARNRWGDETVRRAMADALSSQNRLTTIEMQESGN